MRFISSMLHSTVLFNTVGAWDVLVGKDLNSILSSAQWSNGTIISYPESAAFTNATERWSTFEPPTYAAAVSPATEADVVQALKLATANGIPFLATGGRHGYTATLGTLDNGLSIDLSQFNSVSIDKDAGTLTIGGSVTFLDIYDLVFDAGYEIQTGTCSCTGMVGVTLGAGVGPWQGVHGLVIDALLSLRVVSSNGTILEVSADSHPDLFWAFRGAGANFGIVLSATYQLQEQVNKGQVFVAEFYVPSELNASYFELVQSYDGGKLPDNLAIFSILTYNSTTSSSQLTSTWTYLGPEDEGKAMVQPVIDLGAVLLSETNYPWNKVIESVGGGSDTFECIPGSIHDIYTVNARNLSAETYEMAFAKISEFIANYPVAAGSLVQISVFPNQAALRVPEHETAYPWRDTIAFIDVLLTWDNSTENVEGPADQLGVELRNDFAASSGYPHPAVYINYAHGDETLESRYGERKLPRLAELKKVWDPDNVFGFNNPLPTTYP